VEGTVLIKRMCGHSTPYTFKKNEKFAKERFEKFLSKRCPECTIAAIQEREAQQKAGAQRQKELKRKFAHEAAR
jgi:hypothetical protein